MSDYVQKMREEEKELLQKIEKLCAFYLTEEFNSTDDTEKFLIGQQESAMNSYLSILNRRIKYSEDK